MELGFTIQFSRAEIRWLDILHLHPVLELVFFELIQPPRSGSYIVFMKGVFAYHPHIFKLKPLM